MWVVKVDNDKFRLYDVRDLIRSLENPLAEVEEVLIQLNKFNLTEEQKEQVLANLKRLGEVFEPRKNKLKTLL